MILDPVRHVREHERLEPVWGGCKIRFSRPADRWALADERGTLDA